MKKLLCTVIAFILLSSVFFMRCYAEETTPNGDEVNAKTPLEIAINAVTDFSDWKNGRIDHDTYASRAKENWLAAGYNTTEVFGVNDLMKLLDSCGVDVDGYWDTWKKETLKGYHDIDEQGTLQGYGAYLSYKDNYGWTNKYYFDYGVVYPDNMNNDSSTSFFTCKAQDGKKKSYNKNGEHVSTSSLKATTGLFYSWGTEWQYYGDIRYSDGTQAPDTSTSVPSPSSPSDLNDTDLLRFIDDLQKKVQNYNFDNVQDSLNNIGLQLGDIIAKLGDIKVSVDIAYDGLTTDDFTIKLTPVQLEIVELKKLWESKFTFISQFQEVFKLVKWSEPSSLSIPFDFNGSSNAIDLSMFDPIINTVRIMLCAFIYIAYAVRQFKRMPSIIGGENSD